MNEQGEVPGGPASEHPLNPNRFFYDQLRTPTPDAMKPIGGGRLKGKTDINPQWRWDRMTAVFGPIGFGWTWAIVERWMHHCANEEVLAFVRGELKIYTAERGWSQPIYGMGGSMLVEMENSGQLYNSDEAWKMAETDALGNACKYLGLAADVYRGMMDGSKYDRGESRGPAKAAGPPARLCPKCNGPMYDNTTGPKPYANAADFKCKDPKCAHKVWLTAAEAPKAAAQPAGTQAPLKPVMSAAPAAPAAPVAQTQERPSEKAMRLAKEKRESKPAPKQRTAVELKELAAFDEGVRNGTVLEGETPEQFLARMDAEEAERKAFLEQEREPVEPEPAPAPKPDKAALRHTVKRERGPDGRFPRGPEPDSDPWCPKCGGPMHDMRAHRKNPKAPEWVCQMAVVGHHDCEGVRWPKKADGSDHAAGA